MRILIFIVLAKWHNSIHVGPLRHITLIPSKPVFSLTPLCFLLSRKVAKIYFILFGLTRLGIKLKIFHTQGKHASHYTTKVVLSKVANTNILIQWCNSQMSIDFFLILVTSECCKFVSVYHTHTTHFSSVIVNAMKEKMTPR